MVVAQVLTVVGVRVQRRQVGVARTPIWTGGGGGGAQHPLQEEAGVQHRLLQTQKGHVWPGAGLVAPSCPGLSAALEQWQTRCWVCFVMTAWPSSALPAVALLACHAARLYCPFCMHRRL